MEILQSVFLKGVKLERDEDIEVVTKRGSKFFATIDLIQTLDYEGCIVLEKVDGLLENEWGGAILDLNEIESIRIIEP